MGHENIRIRCCLLYYCIMSLHFYLFLCVVLLFLCVVLIAFKESVLLCHSAD